MSHASLTPDLLSPLDADNDRCESLGKLLNAKRVQLLQFLRRRLRNEDDADDAVQETYARLLSYRAGHVVESPSALLFRLANHVADDYARRELSHHSAGHCPLDSATLVSQEPSQERRLAAEQALVQLVEAVEQLSPKCRQMFLLSRMQGLSYPQIAGTRSVNVEVIVNGKVAATRRIVADGSEQRIQADVALTSSSWVAIRILPALHSQPVFVLLGGRPIRASRASADWCLQCLAELERTQIPRIARGERDAAKAAYAHARQSFEQIRSECRSV